MTKIASENVSLLSPMFPWRLRLLALSILAGLYLMVRMIHPIIQDHQGRCLLISSKEDIY